MVGLVSRKHIITAAHCIQEKGAFIQLEPDESYFMLGKANLINKEEGELKALVEKYVVHPDWDPTLASLYKGDVAIAFLTQLISFTEYIRPICLNEETIAIEDLIEDKNNFGVVAGWGYERTIWVDQKMLGK